MLPWFFSSFLLSSPHFPQITQGTSSTRLVLWDSLWKLALLPDQPDPKQWAKQKIPLMVCNYNQIHHCRVTALQGLLPWNKHPCVYLRNITEKYICAVVRNLPPVSVNQYVIHQLSQRCCAAQTQPHWCS